MSSTDDPLDCLKSAVVSTKDFPKPGIIYRDFLPILSSPSLTRDLIQQLCKAVQPHLTSSSSSSSPSSSSASSPSSSPLPPVIAGLDSRGFLIGPLLAQQLQAPFVPIRKKGKLAPPTTSVEYDLEYGSDILEIRSDSPAAGRDAIIVDDLMATGGTMRAAETLLRRIGAKVVVGVVVIELPDLGGRKKLQCPVESLIQFEGD